MIIFKIKMMMKKFKMIITIIKINKIANVSGNTLNYVNN